MTSCFVYKVMGLTFHDRINTQLIYRIAVAQVVTRRINKPLRTFLGSNLTGCYFSFNFFFLGGGGGGGGSDLFTNLGLCVLGLAVSHINESQLQTYESRTLFLMTSLQYQCILGLAKLKTLHPRDKIVSKRCNKITVEV